MQNPIELTIDGTIGGAPAHLSDRTLTIAALFGLPIEPGAKRLLFDPLTLRINPGDAILITGPSGAGKSTLLNRIAAALAVRKDVRAPRLEEIPLPPDRSVIDCFSGSVDQAAAHLARAGLAEAHIFLRAPAELSEGQRFRYRLAQFFASDHDVLIVDEFAATLDRVTARTVAHQLGKFVRDSARRDRPRAVIVATTHEDLAEDLRPAVHVWKGLGTRVEVRSTTVNTKGTKSTKGHEDGLNHREHRGHGGRRRKGAADERG